MKFFVYKLNFGQILDILKEIIAVCFAIVYLFNAFNIMLTPIFCSKTFFILGNWYLHDLYLFLYQKFDTKSLFGVVFINK